MLSLEKIKEIGFKELEASNGNIYYQKGENILIPYVIGWHLKFKTIYSSSFTYLEKEQDLYNYTNLRTNVEQPLAEDNIYPFTNENVEALLNHYLYFEKGDIGWIYKLKDFNLNQLEFVVRKISEFEYFLDTHFRKGRGKTISNYLHYGIDACYNMKTINKPSGSRIKITSELRNLIFNN